MKGGVDWIAAEAEKDVPLTGAQEVIRSRRKRAEVPVEELGVHSFGQVGSQVSQNQHYLGTSPTESQDLHSVAEDMTTMGLPSSVAEAGGIDPSARTERAPQDDNSRAPEEEPWEWWREDDWETKRERRIYRGRAIAMLRKYMRYSIETGRLPSLLGREFFRAKVTAYTVVTFEDRVIFVIDMERCLEKLDEFSRELIARLILQEHDRWATARLLHCSEKTVRRMTPLVLDLLSEILLEVGLMDKLGPRRRNFLSRGLGSHNFRK